MGTRVGDFKVVYETGGMMTNLKDYKDWIQERAEELVFNLFVEPFDRSYECLDVVANYMIALMKSGKGIKTGLTR